MKLTVDKTPLSQRVTEAAVFAIDMVKRKRLIGLTSDTDISKRITGLKNSVSLWRVGKRTITLEQACLLMEVLKIDANFLFKQQGQPWGEADLYAEIKRLDDRIKVLEELAGVSGKRPAKRR